jgi:hypothetical protein
MAASLDLQEISSGGAGDVATIIASVRPLIQEFRNAGQTVAASNLERDLIELEGGFRFEVGNEDRVEGSVDTNPPIASDRARYEPKNRDEDLIREIEELSPTDHSAEDAEAERKRLIRVSEAISRTLPR